MEREPDKEENRISQNDLCVPSQITEIHLDHEKTDEPTTKFSKCRFDNCSSASNGKPTEIFLDLPEDFVYDAEIFHGVLNKETWDNVLSEEQRLRLMNFLPKNILTSETEAKHFLDKFFANKPHKTADFFVHPLHDFQQKLAGGFYDAVCASEIQQLKACSRLQYEHRIREYYGKVLKKLLVHRRKFLEAAASVPEGEPFSYDWKSEFLDSLQRRRQRQRNLGNGSNADVSSPLWQRAMKRSRLMISDCKIQAGDSQYLSSDDEDISPVACGELKNTPHLSHSQFGGALLTPFSTTPSFGHSQQRHFQFAGHHGHINSSNGDESVVKSTLAKPNAVDLDLHQPLGQDDIKDMLKEFRKLQRSQPEHPSLEYDDIDLDDVVDRAGGEVLQLAQKYGVYRKNSLPDSSSAGHLASTVPMPSAVQKKISTGKAHVKNIPPDSTTLDKK